MREVGVDLSGLSARSPSDVELFSFDLVVSCGDGPAAPRPDLPGMPPHYRWELPSVDLDAPESKVLECLRRARDQLETKIETIFAADLVVGLSIARRNLELVLDNLAHAVMAHTNNRRVFYFNQAAERITGYHREEVIGKDRHDVFMPLRFCGGDCLFCEDCPGRKRQAGTHVAEVPFRRKDGTERILEMNVRPLSDVEGVHVGALVSFRDNTEFVVLKRRVQNYQSLRGLAGKDPKMLALFDQIREVAAVNVPVLVQGESGTGKELVANSSRSLLSPVRDSHHDPATPRAAGGYPDPRGALPGGDPGRIRQQRGWMHQGGSGPHDEVPLARQRPRAQKRGGVRHGQVPLGAIGSGAPPARSHRRRAAGRFPTTPPGTAAEADSRQGAGGARPSRKEQEQGSETAGGGTHDVVPTSGRDGLG
jgi:PAS domain S-box-containing protein